MHHAEEPLLQMLLDSVAGEDINNRTSPSVITDKPTQEGVIDHSVFRQEGDIFRKDADNDTGFLFFADKVVEGFEVVPFKKVKVLLDGFLRLSVSPMSTPLQVECIAQVFFLWQNILHYTDVLGLLATPVTKDQDVACDERVGMAIEMAAVVWQHGLGHLDFRMFHRLGDVFTVRRPEQI